MVGIASRFGIVAFDPRFVGRSASRLRLAHRLRTHFGRLTRDGFERQVAFQHGFADRCHPHTVGSAAHVAPRNAARDLDIVRGALGEHRISYYGFSCATHLGTVYAQMLSGRLDRAVFDAPIDPLRYNPVS